MSKCGSNNEQTLRKCSNVDRTGVKVIEVWIKSWEWTTDDTRGHVARETHVRPQAEGCRLGMVEVGL